MSEFILQTGVEFSTDVTFSQWFCFLINACSSLRLLLCLLEINTAVQGKIQGNLGDFDAQNDVSVWKLQFCFKGYIPRIPSVFCYRGHFLPAYPLNHFVPQFGHRCSNVSAHEWDREYDSSSKVRSQECESSSKVRTQECESSSKVRTQECESPQLPSSS